MQTKPILYIIGLLLLVLSGCMTIPMVIDLAMENMDWKVFGICIIFTSFFGCALALSNKHDLKDISLQEAFILTTISWPILTLFSALPFTLSHLDLSFTDAYFEAMSGITTTGATILTNVEAAPPGILIWRALLQWLGGIGIIIMALSVFPFLRVGGMQLFKTQASHTENIGMRLMRLCTNVSIFYTALTILCGLGYLIGGMSPFDAFAHALSTISSGGFSTTNESFKAFADYPIIELTAIIFMIISGLPLFIVIRALLYDRNLLRQDTQIQTYLSLIIGSTLLLATFFILSNQYTVINAINKAAFNSISMLTGTGFTNTNTSAWGGFALCVIFFLMLVGGCAGSTTSGLKIFRINVLYTIARSQVKTLIHPNGIFPPIYSGRVLNQDTVLSILSYFFAFTIVLAAATLALSYTGLDIITALSASVAAISNVGPGFGNIVGSEATYSTLPSTAKWVMIVAMCVGRLEIFTVLILLSPAFWKR